MSAPRSPPEWRRNGAFEEQAHPHDHAAAEEVEAAAEAAQGRHQGQRREAAAPQAGAREEKPAVAASSSRARARAGERAASKRHGLTGQAPARPAGARPEGLRVAFDFRHPSWRDDATLRLLSKHDVALVLNDEGEGAPRIELTAGFTYVRIRRDDDGPEALDEWAERLGGLARRGIDVYAFLKHDRKGLAVDRAMRLSSLLRAESQVGETAMLS